MSAKKIENRGRPEFVPTQEQRKFVADMAGVKLTHEEIALQVINKQTGKPIAKDTLQKHFAPELAAGKAKLKALIGTKFIDKVHGGDNWALQFGFRHIFGWQDQVGMAAKFTSGSGGEEQSSLEVRFVVPTPRDEDLDG